MYAAPEQWRSEHATAATDIYAFGIIAYELLSGNTPFLGPDFKDQHLHLSPPPLHDINPQIESLVIACLLKASGARPSALEVLERLKAIRSMNPVKKPTPLALVNLEEERRIEASNLEKSLELTQSERRSELFHSARVSFDSIADQLHKTLHSEAQRLQSVQIEQFKFLVRIGEIGLLLNSITETPSQPWGRTMGPTFEVSAHSYIAIVKPGVAGLQPIISHSLWYCDAIEKGRFKWFETGFRDTPNSSGNWVRPYRFSIDPSDEAALALSLGVEKSHVAWEFTQLVPGDIDEFIDRWGTWFAQAYRGDFRIIYEAADSNNPRNWRTEK